MTVTANPKIVEELMRVIRKEVARRQADPNAVSNKLRGPVNTLSKAAVNPQMESIQLPRFGAGISELPAKKHYAIADFLNFHDEAFIRNAYRGLLLREPDVDGFAHYLSALRSGRYTKAEILGRLRYSREGRQSAVRVRGLLVPFVFQMAYQIPVFGYIFVWANFILRLPVIVRNWSQFEAFAAFQQHEQTKWLNQLAERAEHGLRVIDAASSSKVDRDELASLRIALDDKVTLSALQQSLAKLGDKVDRHEVAELRDRLANKADTRQMTNIESNLFVLGETTEDLLRQIQTKANAKELAGLRQDLETKADRAALEEVRLQMDAKADTDLIDAWNVRLETRADAGQLTSLADHVRVTGQQTHATLADIRRQIVDHKRNILDQQRRLALLLEETRNRLLEPIGREQIERLVAEEDHLLDAFYVSFEDCFRGTREDIKLRMEIYLPIVAEAKAGDESAPILDIGCGRGEWLELLKGVGLIARGVDLNRVMVGECRVMGFDVIEADAISYLRTQNANSLGAITGMHIIEHIPFKRLIALFDEVLRNLKPGGVAIFETPNPENLITGACNFYYDPTHLNPLPPEPMRFVMEIRGFSRVEIMRLHPHPEEAKLQEGPEQVRQIINDRFFGAQDYALVAYKL